MSITYPLSIPAECKPRSAEISMRNVVGVSRSPFTLQTQVQAHQGEAWAIVLDFPPMQYVDAARKMIAFLMALRGRYGTFYVGDPIETAPQGPAGGTPVVDGAGQSGHTLDSRGWTMPAGTLTCDETATTCDETDVTCDAGGVVLKAGDWLGLYQGTAQARMHRVTQDTDILDAATGGATIPIWPALREGPDDGEAIETENVQGVFRLAAEITYSVGEAQFYGFTIDAEEVV